MRPTARPIAARSATALQGRRTAKVACEYRHPTAQRRVSRWVEDHGLPIRDAAGRAVRLVGAVSDVTERKKADAALRDTACLNEALLADLNAVSDTIDYAVLFMGPDLRARVINRAFRQMWGIPDAFIATRPTMTDLIEFNRHTGLYGVPEPEFDAFIARRVEAIRAGNIDPVEMRRGDGKILRYQGVVLPDGGRLLTYFDITEAKNREAELGEALEQQTATAEVLQVINASPGDLAPVFDALLERAMRLCGAPLGHLMRYDGGRFSTVALRGVPAAYAEIMSAPVSPAQTGGSLAALVRGEKFVQVADMKESDAYRAGNPARRALVDVAGGRTGIWVALRGDAALLGTLVLYRPEPRPFADREVALLENFATQAAIAMENARLITETSRGARTADPPPAEVASDHPIRRRAISPPSSTRCSKRP